MTVSACGRYSNAPTSHAVPACGRATPRWSIAPKQLAPLLTAGDVESRAWLFVGPPLFASARSCGLTPGWSVATSPRAHVVSSAMLLCVVSVSRPLPAHSGPLFPPMIVLRRMRGGGGGAGPCAGLRGRFVPAITRVGGEGGGGRAAGGNRLKEPRRTARRVVRDRHAVEAERAVGRDPAPLRCRARSRVAADRRV